MAIHLLDLEIVIAYLAGSPESSGRASASARA
jgi:hypothetical protein